MAECESGWKGLRGMWQEGTKKSIWRRGRDWCIQQYRDKGLISQSLRTRNWRRGRDCAQSKERKGLVPERKGLAGEEGTGGEEGKYLERRGRDWETVQSRRNPVDQAIMLVEGTTGRRGRVWNRFRLQREYWETTRRKGLAGEEGTGGETKRD